MMYSIGSRVVHPCYGAGTIVRIQEKSIGDISHSYYVIRTVFKSMVIMVPVHRAQEVGLRDIGDETELRDTLTSCGQLPGEDAIGKDLRARQADMREQLKSGGFGTVADVTRLLFFMNSRRPLGTVDRQLFEQGKEFLAGELALAASMDMECAMQQVERSLVRMLD